MIVQILVDDDVEHAEGKRAVSTRTNLQPDVSLGSKPGQRGIDDDELRAHAHEVDEPVAHETVRVGCERLVGPYDDDLGLDPLRIVITVGVQLGVIENPAVTFLQQVRGHARLIAGVCRKEAKGHVRRTESGTQNHGALPHGVTASTRKGDDALGADSTKLITNDAAAILEGLFDEIESLVPGYALPLVRTLFSVQEQRPFHAIMVVDLLNHVEAA